MALALERYERDGGYYMQPPHLHPRHFAYEHTTTALKDAQLEDQATTVTKQKRKYCCHYHTRQAINKSVTLAQTTTASELSQMTADCRYSSAAMKLLLTNP